MSDNPVFLYAGEYDSVDDAKADLEALKEMHREGGMSRSDVKEVGEMLDNSEAALIVVGEATVERAVEEATERAKRDLKKEIRADAREMERAVDEA
jgi:hypothetical protein